MHIMPGESLAHLLPVTLRVALEPPAVAAGSDVSGVRAIRRRNKRAKAKEEGVGTDVDGVIATGNGGKKKVPVGIFKTGARGSRWGMMVRRRRVPTKKYFSHLHGGNGTFLPSSRN
jgi:hypothetical protein